MEPDAMTRDTTNPEVITDSGHPGSGIPSARAQSGPTLTAAAGLTFASQILLTFTRAASSFILTPVMLSRVGSELFGAWGMLQQLVSYLALGDLRPAGTLKYLLANRQSPTADTVEKQRLIATAVSYSIFSLPVFALLGILATHYVGDLVTVSAGNAADVRLTFIILLVGFFLDRVLSIPSNILAANNMGYAGTVNSLIWLLTGLVASVWVLQHGLGIVALALVTVVTWSLRSVAQFVICVRVLPWVSMVKPLPGDRRAFVGISGWLSLSAISGFFLGFADVLIVGFLLGPKMAAVYGVAGLTSRAVSQLLSSMLASGNAGLLKLLSAKDFARVNNTRAELHGGAVLLMCAVGPMIIGLNDTLLRSWLGEARMTGAATVFCIVLLITIQLWARVDSVLLDGFGAIRLKALTQFGCAVFLAGLAPLAATHFSLIGVIMSLVFSNLIFSWVVSSQIDTRLANQDPATRRKNTTVAPILMLIAFVLAAILSDYSTTRHLIIEGGAGSLVIAAGTAIVCWRFVFSEIERSALRNRVIRVLRRQF